jgi:hypothetical protein
MIQPQIIATVKHVPSLTIHNFSFLPNTIFRRNLKDEYNNLKEINTNLSKSYSLFFYKGLENWNITSNN